MHLRQLQTALDRIEAFPRFFRARFNQNGVVEILPKLSMPAQIDHRGGFLSTRIDHESDATHPADNTDSWTKKPAAFRFAPRHRIANRQDLQDQAGLGISELWSPINPINSVNPVRSRTRCA